MFTVLVHQFLRHGLVEHHILFGQLQQHRIVEELADPRIIKTQMYLT